MTWDEEGTQRPVSSSRAISSSDSSAGRMTWGAWRSSLNKRPAGVARWSLVGAGMQAGGSRSGASSQSPGSKKEASRTAWSSGEASAWTRASSAKKRMRSGMRR